MKHNLKKVLSLCLAFVLVIGLLPATAFADWIPTSGWEIGDGLHWQLEANTLHIIKDGWGGNAMIFQEPNTTTECAGPWYQSAETITGIVIDSGITSIAEGAFAGLVNVKSVIIPESITAVGDSAFASCRSLSSAEFKGIAPATFGKGVFDGCAADFTIYYGDNKDGWSTPTWKSPAGDVYKAIGPDNHVHSYEPTTVVAGTCTEGGYTVFTCSCGDSYTENTDALGHDYKKSGHLDATVDTDGYNEFTCTRCGISYRETLPAFGNEDGMWIEFFYCNYCDYHRVSGEPNGEITIPVGFDKYQTFLFLNDIENPDLLPEDCTFESSDRSIVGVSGNDMDDLDDPFMGFLPGGIWGERVGSAIITITAPNGKSCSVKVNIVPEHEHDFEALDLAPTCTEWGYIGTTTSSCPICSCDWGEREPNGEALGHNYQKSGHLDPTATTEGYDEFTCTRCSDSYRESIPATGGEHEHTYELTGHKDPTPYFEGYNEYTCSGCGDTYTEVLPTEGDRRNPSTIVPLHYDEENDTCINTLSMYVKDYDSNDFNCFEESIFTVGDEFFVGAFTINEVFVPEIAEMLTSLGWYTWHSSDPSIISVEGDEFMTSSGRPVTKFKCNGAGVVTIWAEDSYPNIPIEVKLLVIPQGHDHSEHYTHTYHFMHDSVHSDGEVGVNHYTCSCGQFWRVSIHEGDSEAKYDHMYVETERKEATETEDGYILYTCTGTNCTATKTEILKATGGEKPHEYPFVDMPKEGNWARPGVEYVIDNGLMGGTDATHFSPNDEVSRAMLVTTLWRAAGSPQVEYKGNFSDVKDGKYYTTAVAWAAELGIVRGDSSGRFNPADNVTRQDLANVLYQYAITKGVDTSERYNLGSFSDGKDVSTYAKDAMSWMLAKDILRGADGKITPKDTATRAQFALILMNFIELTK